MAAPVGRVRVLGTVTVTAVLLLAGLVAASGAGAAVSGPANHRLAARCARLLVGYRRAPARVAPGSDPQVVAAFSLFRVARTSRDVLPAASSVARALSEADASSYDPAASVRVDLGAPQEGSVYAVPATLAATAVPERCAHLPALRGLRALLALQNQETGTGPGLCLIATQVVTSGSPISILPGQRRPKRATQTVANAGCESLTVVGSYLGMLGGGLSHAGGLATAVVPDGVTSVTYTFADGRRVTTPVSGNLLTLPAALRGSIRPGGTSPAQLRRILVARAPVTITENGSSGAVVASVNRPPGLIDEYVRLVVLARHSLTAVGGTGSENVLASCSARTHRCVAVVISTSCVDGHHRCRTTRTIHRYRYVGARPPRGTTGPRVVPTAPIRARLNQYVAHPRKLSLVLSGTPHHRVDVLVSVICFSGRQATSVSGEAGPPLRVAVPSRTPLALPNRHRACDVNVFVVSAQRGPVRARLIRG